MSDNLKPCPFCGGPASAFRLHSWTVPSVRCQNSCTDETDIEEWNTRPVEDALRARAEAAEARAAQAQADARLMLAELYYADERCIFDDRLPLDERTAVSGMARAHVSTPRAAWVEAVRRILAAGGAA